MTADPLKQNQQNKQNHQQAKPYLHDLTIYRSKKALRGTCYMEICPTTYRGDQLREDSLFIEDEAFGVFEWAFRRYAKDYDHYGSTNFSARGMKKAARDLEMFEKMILEGKPMDDFRAFCRMATPYLETDLERSLHYQRDKLASTTHDLVQWICEQAKETKHFSVLGI